MKKKVVHVLGSLNHGGVETWLKDVISKINLTKYQVDFILLSGEKGAYSDYFEKYGCNLFELDQGSNILFSFFKQLRKIGAIDILHLHVHFASAYLLLVAKMGKVNKCILHSHNDSSLIQKNSSNTKKLYFELGKFLAKRLSDLNLACSRKAGRAMFSEDENYQLQPYSTDFNKFNISNPCSKEDFLESIKVPIDSKIIGHVGSFSFQKNHERLLQITSKLIARNRNTYLFLVGDGPLRSQMEKMVDDLDIKDNVRFLGLRNDVPYLMKYIFDVFLFPSHYEGLGIVLLESQAAGLPAVFANCIPEEVHIIKELIYPISLEEKDKNWVDKVEGCMIKKVDENYIATMNNSKYSLNSAVSILESFYDGLL